MKSITLALLGGLARPFWSARQAPRIAADGLRQPAAIQQTADSHESVLPLAASGGTNSSASDQQPAKTATSDTSPCYEGGFFSRFWQANVEVFQPPKDDSADETPPARRALPAPGHRRRFPAGNIKATP